MTRVHDALPPAPIGGAGGLTAGTGWFAPGAGLALTSGLGQPPQPIQTLRRPAHNRRNRRRDPNRPALVAAGPIIPGNTGSS
jgi:hypothetical protein